MNVRTLLAAVITVVWIASMTMSFIDRTYTPPAELNALMMVVAGFFFATGLRNGGEGK